MELHEKLYLLRNKYHITQDELAEKLDVSRQSVQKWENGSSKPSIDKIVVLSKIYKVSLDVLLDDEMEISKESFQAIQKKEIVNLTVNDINANSTPKIKEKEVTYQYKDNHYKTISMVLFICQFTFLFVFSSIFVGVFSAFTSLIGRSIFCAIPIWLLVKRKIGKVGTIISVCIIVISAIGQFMEASLQTGYGYDSAMTSAIINTICMFIFIPFAFYFLYKHVYSTPAKTGASVNGKNNFGFANGLDRKYQKAIECKAKLNYSQAIQLFEEVGDYKDSLQQIIECKNKYCEQCYNNALKEIKVGKYNNAISYLNNIKNYKDANILIEKCKIYDNERKYQEAIS